MSIFARDFFMGEYRTNYQPDIYHALCQIYRGHPLRSYIYHPVKFHPDNYPVHTPQGQIPPWIGTRWTITPGQVQSGQLPPSTMIYPYPFTGNYFRKGKLSRRTNTTCADIPNPVNTRTVPEYLHPRP